ncbi:hypothetical protein [Actinophytocola oryzae]|uniref:DUF1508 domain-containing protein n=1 Tax=Actinophytocola oryzae TaxID=502181 RepID=A0A4R7VW00_9PSEU|nr:hypothetical protein [Actinophytocola oryzae]TDV53649.1 hypothetical protein CLV71_104117 [Actinophytocola oryzae]
MTPRFRFRRLPDGTIGWMLLGGNNRLIGMAATGSPTPAKAVSGAERAREVVATADITFMVADDRLWYWRIHDAGVLIAVSASGFARRLDALRAAKRFIRAATTAHVQLGVVTVPDRVRERPGPSRTGTR